VSPRNAEPRELLQRKISSRVQAAAAGVPVTTPRHTVTGADRKENAAPAAVDRKVPSRSSSIGGLSRKASGSGADKDKDKRSNVVGPPASPAKDKARTTRNSAKTGAAATRPPLSVSSTTTNRASEEQEKRDGAEGGDVKDQTGADVGVKQTGQSGQPKRETYEVCWRRLEAALTATEETDLDKLNGQSVSAPAARLGKRLIVNGRYQSRRRRSDAPESLYNVVDRLYAQIRHRLSAYRWFGGCIFQRQYDDDLFSRPKVGPFSF
jgi:hypothetical protein